MSTQTTDAPSGARQDDTATVAEALEHAIEEAIDPIPAPEGATEIIDTDYEIGQHNVAASVTLKYDIDFTRPSSRRRPC